MKYNKGDVVKDVKNGVVRTYFGDNGEYVEFCAKSKKVEKNDLKDVTGWIN